MSAFLVAGADVNFKNPKGTTALMRASQEGHQQVVYRLIQAGASVNESNVRRRMHLHVSIHYC